MGRTASTSTGARLWSKARNVVSALGAFQRPSSKADRGLLSNPNRSYYTRPAIMTESSSTTPPRKRSKKGCIALTACLAFVAVAVIVGTAVGVTESKKHHSGDGDGDPNAYSVSGICSRTL